MNVRAVLRSRVRMLRNGWRARGRHGAGTALRAAHPAVTLGLLLTLAAIFAFGLSSLFGVLAAEGASVAEATPILAIVLSAALVGMLVFDVHHAVASMLLDPDLDWFRRAPVRIRALFAIKLLDSVPRTSSLLFILAVPALATFTERFGIPVWTFVLWPAWLGALWAVPLGAGTTLAMLLLRVVPARRARAVLGLLSTLTLIVLWMANAFVLPQLVEQGEGLVASLRHAERITPLLAAVSPGHAVALAATAAAAGNVSVALAWTLWLVVLALLAIVLAGAAAGATIPALHGRLVVAPGRRRGRTTPGARRIPLGDGMPEFRGKARSRRSSPRPFELAVMSRDLRLYLRDWTVLGDIVTAAVLWSLLPILSARLITATPALMVRAMLIALTVGLGYEVAARAAPFEREAIAWARIAPIAAARWVRAKWLTTAVMSVPIFLVAAGVLFWAVPLPAREWLSTLSMTLSAMAAALSLGLWTGLRFGDPGWTNPRAMLTVGGRIAATGILLGQATLWLILAAVSWILPGGAPGASDLWLPPLIAAAVTAGVGKLSERRVATIGQ
jgi:hypothetical protein